MPPAGYVKIRLKQGRSREEWERLYWSCKDSRLKEHYHCMLLSFDYSWKEIARILHCDYKTVLEWVKAYNENGLEGLALGKARGGEPKLTPQQQSIVASVVLRGPRACSLPVYSWDTKSIAAWIGSEFKVKLSREAVRKLLRRLGFTWHRPEHRYVRADPEQQKAFIKRLNGEVRKMGPNDVLLFCDECSLNHHPRLHSAWLPKGLRSIVKTYGTHAKEHVYGAVNVLTGKLLYRIAGKMRATEYRMFLEHILRAYPGRRIILVLDGGRIHTAKIIGEFIKAHNRIKSLWLPSYSPRLNPVEQLWKELRAKVVSNRFFRYLSKMVSSVAEFFDSLTRTEILKICSADYLLGLR